ncbi:MAG: 30S ribosomal protein S9 [Candidatus Roizmanbacteria bacterium GW2011_GWA2_36_23]|uniref:30S ribosomal protein S9 n=1 Tax=Candidatus Roizmanbacteria bacterium GW2011_GWA2_36_23 TaxID=1618480 RepID=A0A0G0E5H4_9BACT|nr:MAG: 30S ribosomal protein S9 [Candidatus Roizmanbacteria bacterium GW2011_GWA2_36_23]
MPKKTKNIEYYEAVGRRKTSIARVRLYIVNKEKIAIVNGNKIKAGEIYINNKPAEKTFPALQEKEQYLLPLRLTQNEDRFAISILLRGGGRTGQVEAMVHGLSRALLHIEEATFKPLLRKEGLLTRDPRARERRKVGTGGKARRSKQSPKR